MGNRGFLKKASALSPHCAENGELPKASLYVHNALVTTYFLLTPWRSDKSLALLPNNQLEYLRHYFLFFFFQVYYTEQKYKPQQDNPSI